MRTLAALTSVLSVPIQLLNLLGAVVSGIWLAILGQWWAVGWGMAGMFLSTWLLSFVLTPALLLGAPGMYLHAKGYTRLMYPLAFLSSLYTVFVVTGWCVFVLNFFIGHSGNSTFFPLLIWSYGVATGPWTYMAAKDGPDALGSFIAAFFAQAAYIAVMITVTFLRVSILDITILFAAVMLFALFIQFKIAITMQRQAIVNP